MLKVLFGAAASAAILAAAPSAASAQGYDPYDDGYYEAGGYDDRYGEDYRSHDRGYDDRSYDRGYDAYGRGGPGYDRGYRRYRPGDYYHGHRAAPRGRYARPVHYRQRCGDGTVGAVVGGVVGALIGRGVDRGGGYYRRGGTTGAIVGGGVGALIGSEIGRSC